MKSASQAVEMPHIMCRRLLLRVLDIRSVNRLLKELQYISLLNPWCTLTDVYSWENKLIHSWSFRDWQTTVDSETIILLA